MSLTYEDIEAYAFGLVAVLVIYAVLGALSTKVIPWLFGRAKEVAAPVTAPITAKISEAMKPKFPFPAQSMPGEEAMAAFESARKSGAAGAVVFAWSADQLQNHADSMSYRKDSVEQILAKAEATPEPYPSRSTPKQPAVWPAAGPFKNNRVPFLVTVHPEGFKPEASLVTTPARDDAEIFAHLKFGGWNGCPEAPIHVALMRKWQRDYAAELVAFSHDAIDIRVKRRPKSKAEALKLAREHQKYAPVNEATIAEIAAELMETDWWHFWWD